MKNIEEYLSVWRTLYKAHNILDDFCLYKQRTAQNQNHCVIPSGLQYLCT